MLTLRHATWKSPSESGRKSWEKDERKVDEAQDVADVVDENMDVVDDQSEDVEDHNEKDEPPESPRGKCRRSRCGRGELRGEDSASDMLGEIEGVGETQSGEDHRNKFSILVGMKYKFIAPESHPIAFSQDSDFAIQVYRTAGAAIRSRWWPSIDYQGRSTSQAKTLQD